MATSSGTSPTPRRYDASRRQAQARATSRQIVEAAAALFLERGYGATSLDEIARRAGVSTPTVYAKFGTKAGLLKVVVDQMTAGDDEDVPLLERADQRAILGIEPLGERVRAMCEASEAIHRRSAPLLRLVSRVSGSDPAVAELHADLERQLREATAANIDSFPRRVLRPGVDRERAVDISLALAHPEVWNRLVLDAGWTSEEYVDWLVRALRALVVDLDDG